MYAEVEEERPVTTQRAPILLLVAIAAAACSTSNGAAPGQNGGFGGLLGPDQGGMSTLGGAKGAGATMSDAGCAPGFGDCNSKDDDGCETNLRSDKQNCGACRISCGDTECLNGGCKCAGSSVKPKKVPLDMYIVFDESLSMNDNVNGGSKWTVI